MTKQGSPSKGLFEIAANFTIFAAAVVVFVASEGITIAAKWMKGRGK